MSSKTPKRKAKEETDHEPCKKKLKSVGKSDQILVWSPHEKLGETYCNSNLDQSFEICRLLENGNSIPFIARYRQAITGGMKPDELRKFHDDFEMLRSVEDKARKLLKLAEKEGCASVGFKETLAHVSSLDEVETLSAQFRTESKGSLAARAKKIGLDEVALGLLQNTKKVNLWHYVDSKVEGRKTIEEVKTGILHIITDILANSKDTLTFIRDLLPRTNVILQTTKAKETKAAIKKKAEENVREFKYEDFFNFSCPVKSIKQHQILAINRGERQKVISVKVVLPDFVGRQFVKFCEEKYLRLGRFDSIRSEIITSAINDSFTKYVVKRISRSIRNQLTVEAEKSAIQDFGVNLRNLLLQPPTRGKVILGIDPGFKNGCKLSVIDESGSVLHVGKIFPRFNQPHVLSHQDKELLRHQVMKNKVEVIALGNGTASRETEKLIGKMIEEKWFGKQRIHFTLVNEQGVSIFSCSPLAEKDHPGMDPGLISAISIARRLQDPLSEFIKVDPWHLGVGMYQHDLSQKRLQTYANSIVEECVSFVGVDINYAPLHILTKIAGVGEATAKALVDYRKEKGRFSNREELKKVKGIGEKMFNQMSGFVRIFQDQRNAEFEPLDSYLIHPEMYGLARNIYRSENFNGLDVGTDKFREHFKKVSTGSRLESKFPKDIPNLRLIVTAFSEPLHYDIRNAFSGPIFRENVASINDLKVGMVMDGKVQNVVSFGAFVDIGVGQDGLVHTSKLKNVQLAIGQKVKVRILEFDLRRGRIGLDLNSC